ncbi:tripartite tricarboxylate transporter TctB family protein [Stella sp.]|uniref:tripartite tricarboxylate transporter TctB family protein n=1 Tax=Stella sp. TaxID=2912054 RepID=UPI0035B0E092
MTDAADPPPMDHVRPEPAPRTDLATGALVLAFGLAVLRMAWDMPTFTDRGGDPFTAPGIVPGFYGTVLAILGIVLAGRSIARGALRPGGGAGPATGAFPHSSISRLAAAVVVCLGYSVGLIGLLPFWLATAIFVTAFILLFEWQDEPPARRLRRVATAAVLGLATGAAVMLVFEKLFLVRLP